jgi:hydrogenase-4 component B
MTLLLMSLLLFGAGSGASLIFARRDRLLKLFGPGGIILGSICGLAPALRVATGAPPLSLRIAWSVPYGSFCLRLDALSAFFLVPIFLICALAALYGTEYLEAYRERKSLAPAWFFLNVLTASMTLVVLADNAVLFLMAWETMALSSFFLVTFEGEKKAVCQAGWTYLVASHIGTTFLLALFVLLGKSNGSLDFAHFSPASGASALFVLALVGFGTKAGFVPLHVWLPEAHPAAPSHVSAVMSAVMIKTGIYGLLRVLTFLGPMQGWWGWTLCVLGLASGILGVLLALVQHDIKRLLAYSSVENIGIIALGIGVGIVGLSAGNTLVAVSGFAGALLHVLNHSLLKAMLFFGAGNVVHTTHTREIDRLGGLLARMPGTGATFLVGAAAIAGLPPLNGFISEFLIYLASFKGAVSLAAFGSVPLLATVFGLALIGGVAVACFTKAFGIMFLGQPRSEHAEHAHEAGMAMLAPGFVLATACVSIGLFGASVVRPMAPLISSLTRLQLSLVRFNLGQATDSVERIGQFAAVLIAITALLTVARTKMLARRRVSTGLTRDCGYASPSPRMQYTASSFAQPLAANFRILLQTREAYTGLDGFFPQRAEFHSRTDDPYRSSVFEPLFRNVSRAMAFFRPLQQGRVQVYVLYIAITLLVLLLWQIA